MKNKSSPREVITLKTAIAKIPEKVKELLDLHEKDLEEAWANVGDEGLMISLSAKIGFDKHQKGICDVKIGFIVERVNDIGSFGWDDHQLNLLKTVKL